MKYSDIDTAKKAKIILERIEVQIQECKRLLENHVYEEHDCGGIEGVAEYGYWANISKHQDGSGSKLDLSGCYIGHQLIESTQNLLENKREELLSFLAFLGVEFENN